MEKGKRTCRILKDIRRQIAEANDIEFITSECRYKGDCFGTCPKCEAEVLYLEQQLQARRLSGKVVVLAGLSAGIIALSGCGTDKTSASSETRLQGEPPEMVEDSTSTIADRSQCEADTQAVTEKGKNIEPVKVEDIAIVGMVYVPASFPGGDDKLNEWLHSHLQYPEEALPDSIEGVVKVSFTVNENGSVSNASIVKSLHPALDKEAIRVVESLPAFKPCTFDDIPNIEPGREVTITFKMPENAVIRDSVPPNKNAVFGAMEQMPIFPGGDAKLMEWVKSHMQYPEEALQDSIEGRVVVQFVVKADGSIDNIDVVRSKHPALDAEAIRVTKTLPNFKPIHGKTMEYRYLLPIIFKLPRQEE